MSDFRRKLADFFDAENRRDWDSYREFLLGRGADWNGRSLICRRGQEETDEIPL